MAKPASIEVKVGILILVAIGILTGFVVIMGGLSFQPTYRLFVEFDNPGGLQAGAPVKIAGITVGKVKEVLFRGAQTSQPGAPRTPLVRLNVSIEKRYQQSLRENALFYVTAAGVLGENFLAIEPGSGDRPVLADGAVTRGIDPPRLDLVLAEGYDLLHLAISTVRENRGQIAEVFDGLRGTLNGTAEFFRKHKDRLDRVAANIEQITVDADELIQATRGRVDSAEVTRIIKNLDETTASVARDADPLIKDAREAMANANRISSTFGSPGEQERFKQTIRDVADLAARAKSAAADAQTIVAQVKKGKGSVGAFVMDEQLYDDLQEMVRDLKHNPWKFFWKE